MDKTEINSILESIKNFDLEFLEKLYQFIDNKELEEKINIVLAK